MVEWDCEGVGAGELSRGLFVVAIGDRDSCISCRRTINIANGMIIASFSNHDCEQSTQE